MSGKPPLNSFRGFVEVFVVGLWNKHPVKLKYIQKHRRQIPNPNPRGRKATVWGGLCALCDREHIISNIEVDHIDGGNYSLKTVEDIQLFFENIVLVTEKDLRFLCKECNATCTYAKRNNLTYEEAFCKKFILKLIKDKEIKDFFVTRGLDIPKNQKLQSEKALEILLEDLKKCPKN